MGWTPSCDYVSPRTSYRSITDFFLTGMYPFTFYIETHVSQNPTSHLREDKTRQDYRTAIEGDAG